MKPHPANLLPILTLSLLMSHAVHAQWVQWEPALGGNGHWYKAELNPDNLTPRRAAELARREGGYLATIGSAEENTFVFSLVNAPQFFTTVNGAGPVLGGRQQAGSPEPAGGWYWNTGEPWDYVNWSPESPNNDAPGGEDALQFYSGLPGTPAPVWNDLNLDNPNCGGYVIEREDDTHRPWVDIRVSQVEICWPTAASTWYQVQYRSTLTTNQWLPLSVEWVVGDGSEHCVTDGVLAGRPQRYYRVASTNAPPQ